MENKNNTIEVNKNTEVKKDTGMRWRTPDGLVFTSKEEFLDYMEGLRS